MTPEARGDVIAASPVVAADDSIAGRRVHGCTHCGAAWLLSESSEPPSACALCGQGSLEPRSARVEGEPELAVPFAIDPEEAARRLRDHVSDAVMPVRDAHAAANRLVAHFVPAWLVDAHALASWEIEVGFDYEVESTVERYHGGRWTTEPTKDRRIRWEPRAGTIDRWYDNEAVPALTTWSAWRTVVPGRSREGALQLRHDGPILLPDRTPREAWPDAITGLKKRIAADVQRANQAQHARELFVGPVDPAIEGGGFDTDALTWSWLLFPVYAAPYTDHEGVVRMLRVDGRTGVVHGAVAASPNRGRFRAMLWAATGLGVLGVSAFVALPGIVFWPLLLLTAIGGVLGFVLLVAAIGPLLRVRSRNAALPDVDPFLPSR